MIKGTKKQNVHLNSQIDTFSSELLVVDPNHLEEQCKEGNMTITMNINKEICALSKAGGIPLEMDQVLRCSQIALIKVTEVTELIQKTLQDNKS